MGDKYKLITSLDMSGDGVVLEIGSEQGQGSTLFLHEFCKQRGINFYSIDWDDKASSYARGLCGDCSYQQLGEDFLNSSDWKDKNEKIKFAYLDNYDWMWNGVGHEWQ